MRLLTALLALALALPAGALEYPRSERRPVTDEYPGGNKVVDDFRWLEDTDSADTADWVKAQNKLTLPYLQSLPERAQIRARLAELWNYERYGVPVRKAKRLFFTRNDGLQNQAVLYVQDDGGAPRKLLDPNTLSADGTIAMTQWAVAPDAKHVAYALATAGSDWNEFRVLNLEDGKVLDDSLKRIKFSGIEWTRDGAGFFYSRYPEPPKDLKPGSVFEELANSKLYYHKLGDAQAGDALIYERPDQPKWQPSAKVTDDGRFLFIRISAGTDNSNALYYKYLGDPAATRLDGKVTALVEGINNQYEPLGNEGSIIYLLTTLKAPKKRIIAIDLRAPEVKNWVPLILEGDDPIETALMAGRQFVVVSMHDAHHRLLRYSLDGGPAPELKMPGLGSVTDTPADGLHVSGTPGNNEFFYSYTDYSHPPQNQRCDLKAGRCEVFQPVKLAFNPDDYVTEQVFYKSKDGTRVPMFLTFKKGWTRKAGTRPTLLYGYGGFDYAQLPSFARVELSIGSLAWMEQGGVYAVACLRGGGEYGKAWHEAGTKARKQNVFDDFIYAAKYLIAEGYTTSPQLAIHGRSNGGLLVGAVLNQAPELFGAAVADVGVMDMLRFHKFTIGWAWVDDYGSSDDAAGFKVLRAYSPYHNIKPGTKYPATMATTGDHDDRVVPGHSFKYIAALQAAQAANPGESAPVLIRIDVKAGHGPGKPTAKLMDEVADRVAFITHFTRTGARP